VQAAVLVVMECGMNRPDFDFDPDQQPDLMIAT
jgi:hypothetical protein